MKVTTSLLVRRIRAWLRRCGVDVVRYHRRQPGTDAGRDLQAVLGKNARPVILDVGAREGDSIAYFRGLFTGCTVHSFEPSPTTFRDLQRNYGHLPDVHLNELALGSSPGTAELLENADRSMTSILAPSIGTWGIVTKTTAVGVATVDGYLAKAGLVAIDILKVDTQGFDLEVLKGAAGTLAAERIAVVLVEVIFADMYVGGATLDEIYGFITGHGFRLKGFYDVTSLGDMAGWADALFVHASLLT